MPRLQMLALIGEQVEEKDEVCGAVVSIRPSKDRVAVWTKSADKESLQVSHSCQSRDADLKGFVP